MYYKLITLCERISAKILNIQIFVRNINQLDEDKKQQLRKDIDYLIEDLITLKNKL